MIIDEEGCLSYDVIWKTESSEPFFCYFGTDVVMIVEGGVVPFPTFGCWFTDIMEEGGETNREFF